MDNDEALNAALDQLAAQMNKPGVQEWLAIRKEAGQTLDPETAEVTWWYAHTLDPYGVCEEFPECHSACNIDPLSRGIGFQN
jgi:hypothetical protein